MKPNRRKRPDADDDPVEHGEVPESAVPDPALQEKARKELPKPQNPGPAFGEEDLGGKGGQ